MDGTLAIKIKIYLSIESKKGGFVIQMPVNVQKNLFLTSLFGCPKLELLEFLNITGPYIPKFLIKCSDFLYP